MSAARSEDSSKERDSFKAVSVAVLSVSPSARDLMKLATPGGSEQTSTLAFGRTTNASSPPDSRSTGEGKPSPTFIRHILTDGNCERTMRSDGCSIRQRSEI